MVSSVDYATGFAVDMAALGALCREKGLVFGVDAIQGLGVLPLDVKACGVHFLAAGGHKWLMGPMGTGLFYLDRQVNDLFAPPLVGWRSVDDEEDFALHFRLKEDARRFENGTLNMAGIYGLGAALDLLLEVGVERIRRQVFGLIDRLAEELTARGLTIESSPAEGERSGILVFEAPGDPERCFRHLLRSGVMLSLRQSRLRLAPHFYNDAADIDAFLGALDDFSQST
ncbi:MAG: aminotransferase class V-fold PLP-dependent enzyme [Desulfuromonadales bacterium]|nr:aminotransferase class V-fold PLP-dependent enzyme [Desulfuromonadales bacterium]